MGCATRRAEHQITPSRNFHFPIKRNVHLLPKWEKFVKAVKVRDMTWSASKNSVLCSKHFAPNLIKENNRSATLDWPMNPVPTIYVNEKFKSYPSLLPTPTTSRKSPKKRNLQEDELPMYLSQVDPFIKNVFDLERLEISILVVSKYTLLL